jgi:hypothetical protein
MYGVIRRYRLAEGVAVAELMQRVQQGFVPIVSRMPGFMAFQAIDLGDGAIVSISVFDGRDNAEASGQRAADHIRDELAAFFAGPPEVEAGEVGAYGVQPPAADAGSPLLDPAG